MKFEPTNKLTSDGALLWRVCEDTTVQLGIGAFTIPAGFHTDFASVPKFLQPLLSEVAIRSLPAVAHDWLYFKGEPKRIADAVFFELLGELDVPHWQRVVMFTAVEWFGAAAYERHRRLGHPEKHTNRF